MHRSAAQETVPAAARREARLMRCWVYLRRFLTLWVAEDPDPVYSWLDSCDGLGERGMLGVAGKRATVDVDN